jgi:hypothetical protein
MALDRSEICSKKYTTEAACMADIKNRCFWSKVENRGICLSADYAEVCVQPLIVRLCLKGWAANSQKMLADTEHT